MALYISLIIIVSAIVSVGTGFAISLYIDRLFKDTWLQEGTQQYFVN